MPSLRDRGKDIALIANTLAHRIATEEGRPVTGLSKASEAYLHQHKWPGNVRELQNALRRAIITGSGGKIELTGMTPPSPRLVGAPQPDMLIANDTAKPLVARAGGSAAMADFAGMTLEQVERMAIEQAIARSSGNICAAARGLGVSPSTIYRKLERWGG